MAINLADLLTSEASAVGHPSTVESVRPITQVGIDTSLVTNGQAQTESIGRTASSATGIAQTMPPVSGSHVARRYNNYGCVVCGHMYDRAQRARDCANRDRGLTPYVCGAECGRMNWYVCSHCLEEPAFIRGQHQSLQL
ncbi:hypothetical protein M408DRAFT_299829 [Serendipita vermifera MAFF 305830]|uniref:Uncharacterized protein n=1 Tax=Serendipita vermifera MAFF 305830 TaxID=933852 RepID=A0A0C3AP28_SERVB|nr:hypothetical protein M408DRAFT_299829 [Serendipita vermifera MAFF 305830]